MGLRTGFLASAAMFNLTVRPVAAQRQGWKALPTPMDTERLHLTIIAFMY